MVNSIFIFIAAFFFVLKGATIATKYAAKLAGNFKLSKYTVGFIIVAIISILPETFISINSALEGIPSFGLGVLFGSNVADLTVVFLVILMFSKKGIKVENKILKNNKVYPFLLLLPLVLGLDGFFSRLDGITLIIVGSVFYYLAFKKGINSSETEKNGNGKVKSLVFMLGGMVIMLLGAHFTVKSAVDLASAIGINPILIGMIIVGLGTTLPEMFFSIKSVERDEDNLAVGDILGTVLADATIVVGILALTSPFSFPQKIIYITGVFMVVASVLLFVFMSSGRLLSKKEGWALLIFWLLFILVEFLAVTQ